MLDKTILKIKNEFMYFVNGARNTEDILTKNVLLKDLLTKIGTIGVNHSNGVLQFKGIEELKLFYKEYFKQYLIDKGYSAKDRRRWEDYLKKHITFEKLKATVTLYYMNSTTNLEKPILTTLRNYISKFLFDLGIKGDKGIKELKTHQDFWEKYSDLV